MLGTAAIIFTAAASILSVGNHEGDIQSYEKRLDAFNAVYGVNLEIPDDDNAKDFYEAMSFAEFDSYIMSIYDGSIYDTERPSIYNGFVDGTMVIEEGFVPPMNESSHKDL